MESSVCYHNNPFLQKRISAVNTTPSPNSGTIKFPEPLEQIADGEEIFML